ncbi:hypothetical protein CDD81_1860 [Ophiocordyceps australis]|uniref:Palmitoyltransferase n=1 Tax=Ophiocordyceps australis TaxID=1399860 RepID=A0A2C5XSR3_9HYPO|nr:hypothetical protein CDD81_1860 [Ophiocordyceps australis]
MARRCVRKMERVCCSCLTYLPVAAVYALTTWAVWVLVVIGTVTTDSAWIGLPSSIVSILLYLLLNWSYSAAVFTNPGSTTTADGYGLLPTSSHQPPVATSFTVKSNGGMRFCKKCQARKPDRAHHCSTCRRCVLKMDHHCPWLNTCVGLRNHKAFLLFLIYTTLFSVYAFAISGAWVWGEVTEESTAYVDALMPVNFIVLAVLSGIIGAVVGVFTLWHVFIASRGQTTMECLEKTRYLSPLRKTHQYAHDPANHVPQAAQDFVDFHTNALPGITRPEEGEEQQQEPQLQQQQSLLQQQQQQHYFPSSGAPPLPPPPPSSSSSPPPPPPQVQMSYHERERFQSRKRYDDFLDEQDSDKLPHAFDLGWRRNLTHLFGPAPYFWLLPISNTTGDGWSWEASPRWLEARTQLRLERHQQYQREVDAGWGTPPNAASPMPNPAAAPGQLSMPSSAPSASSTPRRTPSKADRILGRDPNLYADGAQSVQLQRLSRRGRLLHDDADLNLDLDLVDDDDDDDEDANGDDDAARRKVAEQRALHVVTNTQH